MKAQKWIVTAALLALAAPASAAGLQDGANFLTRTQQADGGWSSASARRSQATTEAVLALQALGAGAVERGRAVAFLESAAPEDSDDRARMIASLLGEGRDASMAVTQLLSDAAADSGWGLTPELAANPLDTALALTALAAAPGVAPDTLGAGVMALLASRSADGSWPCVDRGENDLYCTGVAVYALSAYRSRFYLEPALAGSVTFLKSQLNADGSFGTGGDVLVQTASAALGLAAAQATGAERLTVIQYLQTQQQADGSWNGDPHTTALVLRALRALLSVPVCGDGVVNQASERCDRVDFAGATCESLGLGPGSLQCSSSCTLETTGCSDPPRCGDGVRNQEGEACDVLDLGGATCQSIGYLGGTLGCTASCTFDASACTGIPSCGDGVINRPEEQCDRTDLGGATCGSLGLLGGTLGCSLDCTFATNGCTGTGETAPRSIEIGPGSPVCTGGAETVPVSITFPPSSVIDKVDVFLLFDDTGSFAGRVPTVRNIFSALVTDLQAAMPGVSFGFGVGRFEDYGGPGTGYSGEFTTGRPFTLNQPIITTDTPSFSSLISTALARTAPGFGGDGPESNMDALFQTATGAGFDGNANASTLDSGPAGAAATQTTPGASGDVPPFSSNVAPTSGTLGGVGFRPRALHLVIQAGDVCPISAYAAGSPVPPTVTGIGGATVPTSALRCTNFLGSSRYGFVGNNVSRSANTVPNAVVPKGAPTVPETVGALNALGIRVIGLADGGTAIRNPVGPSTAPSVFMSAMALLTGATDATGNPLVFNISGGTTPLKNAIVQAVTTAATRPVDVALRPVGVPAGLVVSSTPDVVPDVGPGQTASFQTTFDGDGTAISGPLLLEFVDVESNSSLGAIPVSVACLPIVNPPPDADGDGFPADRDCDDTNPDVNPGEAEIPGNGIDDDCNPGTPDEIPLDDLVCTLKADRLRYPPGADVQLEAVVTSLSDGSLVGVDALLAVTAPSGGIADSQTQALAPLAPGASIRVPFTVATGALAPGEYLATLTLSAASRTLAACQVPYAIEGTPLLGGAIAVDPAVVDAGDPTSTTYSVRNQGNLAVSDLPITVLVVDPDSGQVMATLNDTAATIAVGGTYSTSRALSTTGLLPKTYLVILRATVDGAEQTLASTTLLVVNQPPDCAAVRSSQPTLWPPNHQFENVTAVGATDPDGDPVTVTITEVLQDEPTNALGDGNTCPDATGTGTSSVRIRAERSGTGDGRVYHLRYIVDDGRGGTCGGTVTVCVPHDRASTCGDQGPVYSSGVCR